MKAHFRYWFDGFRIWPKRVFPSEASTAGTAGQFLGRLLERTPFGVKAIQVDGGSEFQAGFERACAERGVRLFVLPSHSPKLNGHVERAQRTHKEELN